MMNGGGGNGKGVICNIMRTVLGKYYKNADNSILKELVKGGSSMGEHVMDLMGKRMITFDEPSGINNDVMKKLTSTTDTITARRLYGSNVEFTPNWTAFFLFNNPPEFNQDDTSNSIARRIHDLFFPRNFTKDPSKVGIIEQKKGYTVEWKLANEKYASCDWIDIVRNVIFNMLTNVWRHYESNGRVVFTPPEIVKRNTNMMVGDLNPFSEILGFLQITTEKTEPVKAKDIWDRFVCTEKYIHLSIRKKKSYTKKGMLEWLEQRQFLFKTFHKQLWIVNSVFIDDNDVFGTDNGIVEEEIEVEE
jgi:phage/plasmid-associated DNA primase